MTTTQKAVLLHPMGSMGEEIPGPAVRLLGADPGDRAHDAVAVFGYVKDGVVVVTEERHSPYVPGMPIDLWLHVRGCDCDYCTWERANGGDPLHRAAQEWHEEQDRAEIERINLTGARYRESVRLSAHGSEPWDYAAGDAAA